MPKGLKRYYGLSHLHFVTFSCYRRLPLLRTANACNAFVDALGKMRERYDFLLVGYVVMPEHVHLLISESAKANPSIILSALKQRVSRDLLKEADVPKGADGAAHFWQPRFHDFNVHSAKKRREKLDYMHANPVKRGLVKNPSAWIWSSASFYAKGVPGLVPIDPVP